MEVHIQNINNGDEFKLVKNAYKYIIKNQGWWKVAERDPNYDGYFFTKGEIVVFTGNVETDVEHITDTNYYFEVKSKDGSKVGLIHADNIEPYNYSRPGSIEEFIKKYNVDSLNSYSELDSTTRKYYDNLEKLSEEGALINPTIHSNDLQNTYNNIINNYDEETGKQECISKYNGILDIAAVDADDSDFMIQAYLYAFTYNQLTANRSEETDDPKQDFDKAERRFDRTDSQTEKVGALKDMENALNRMKDDDRYDDETIEKYEDKYLDAKNELNNDVGNDMVEQNQNNQDSHDNVDDILYKKPELSTTNSSSESLEDMMNDGDAFISSSNNANIIKQDELQSTISVMYNIFLEVGVALAVIIGLLLGIKFMIGSTEEKAEIKKLLLPYVVGCLVVFGAFGIWKFVLTLMETV